MGGVGTITFHSKERISIQGAYLNQYIFVMPWIYFHLFKEAEIISLIDYFTSS